MHKATRSPGGLRGAGHVRRPLRGRRRRGRTVRSCSVATSTPGRTTGAIFTIRPDGAGVRQITRPARGVIDQYPDFSPDGKNDRLPPHGSVPCRAVPRTGWTAPVTSSTPSARTGRGSSPSCRAGSMRAGRSRTRASEPTRRPGLGRFEDRLLVQPRREEYDESLDLNRAIWIADADGTDRRQVTGLTPGSSWDDEPQWSPDGRKLVFTRVD